MTTVNPNSLRIKFIAGLLLSAVALLLIGAGRVNYQLSVRDKAVARAEQRATVWHTQLATELPEQFQAEWMEVGRSDPMALLRACSVETIPTR